MMSKCEKIQNVFTGGTSRMHRSQASEDRPDDLLYGFVLEARRSRLNAIIASLIQLALVRKSKWTCFSLSSLSCKLLSCFPIAIRGSRQSFWESFLSLQSCTLFLKPAANSSVLLSRSIRAQE